MPVEVHVDAPGRREQLLEQLEPALQHREEAIESLPPGVAVGEVLDEGRLLLRLDALLLVEVDVDGVVGAKVAVHHERRVDVDEVDLLPIPVLARRRVALVEQRLERDEVVVGPDEAVRRQLHGTERAAGRGRRAVVGLGVRVEERLAAVAGAAGAHDLDDLRRDGDRGLLAVHALPGEARLARLDRELEREVVGLARCRLRHGVAGGG